jgi:hypothetical protein
MARRTRIVIDVAVAVAAAATVLGTAVPAGATSPSSPFLAGLRTITTVASTVPANGDVNPYGVAVVAHSTGRLHRGWVLVSNFNAVSNEQGTGTTIVEISPSGTVEQFAQLSADHLPGACPGGIGLTTALSVLSSGWVIVGSLPTADGTSATAQAGCLLVLDSHGRVRETIANRLINGPWDMTAAQYGNTADLFVTNVLNGTVAADGATVDRGTVVRIRLHLSTRVSRPPIAEWPVVIGSGFAERTDPDALVIGPTGVALSRHGDTLYVADSATNRIAAIPDASGRRHTAFTGHTVTAGGSLNTPLGVTVAPGGDILSVNAGDGLIVETTPRGSQVATKLLDDSGSPAGSGALFGLALTPSQRAVYFVDDAVNTLDLLHR